MQDLKNYIAVILLFILFALTFSLLTQLKSLSGIWVLIVAATYVITMLGILTVLFRMPIIQKIEGK